MSHIEDLYQKSKQENVPHELDNLILNAAKNSCETPAIKKTRKWLYALPTAAVIMLSFSLILNLQNSNQITQEASELIIQSPQVEFPNKKAKKSSQNNEFKSKDKPIPMIVQDNTKAVVKVTQPIDKPKVQSMEPQIIPSNIVMEDKITSSGKLARSINAELTDKENRMETEETISQDSLYSTTVEPTSREETDGFIVRNSQYVELLKTEKVAKTSKKESTLQSDIKRLERLIEQHNFKRAHKLLEALKLKHPSHDFKDIESTIQ